MAEDIKPPVKMTLKQDWRAYRKGQTVDLKTAAEVATAKQLADAGIIKLEGYRIRTSSPSSTSTSSSASKSGSSSSAAVTTGGS